MTNHENSEQGAIVDSQIAALHDRMTALEKSDRAQHQLLKRMRQIQMGCVAVISIGFLLSSDLVKDEANQATLERIVIGMIGTGASGLVGSTFLSPDKKDDDA